MMNGKPILGALALATALSAGPVLAQTQLERVLGVDAGTFTLAQLIDLQRANDDDDRFRRDYVLSQAGVVSTRATNRFSSPLSAIHRAQVIDSALEENELFRARHAASGQSNDTSRALAVTKAQIAVSVGVKPDDYTLSQLVKLQSDRQD